jgi:hypothetical protein
MTAVALELLRAGVGDPYCALELQLLIYTMVIMLSEQKTHWIPLCMVLAEPRKLDRVSHYREYNNALPWMQRVLVLVVDHLRSLPVILITVDDASTLPLLLPFLVDSSNQCQFCLTVSLLYNPNLHLVF